MYRSVVLSDPAYAAIDQRRFRFSKGVGLAVRQATHIGPRGHRLRVTMREGEELADWFGGQDTPWSHEAEQAVRAALESPLATDRLVIC